MNNEIKLERPPTSDPNLVLAYQTIDDLRKQIVELKRQLGEAQEDSKRVNWLENNVPLQLSKFRESECAGDYFEIIFGATGLMRIGKPLRSVVDAAIAATPVDFAPDAASDLLCAVHANLDSRGKLEPFDNCIACIRNERNELRAALAEAGKDKERLREALKVYADPANFAEGNDWYWVGDDDPKRVAIAALAATGTNGADNNGKESEK